MARYNLTQKDRDFLGRTLKELKGRGRGELPLPRRRRVVDGGGSGSDLPFQLAVVTDLADEPTYSGSGLTFQILPGNPGYAVLLENLPSADLGVDESSGTTLADLQFSFVNVHRDTPIGVGDVIRVWNYDGSVVTAGQFPEFTWAFGEFYNATEHLRRLAGYSANPADPLTLHTDADELYWDVGGIGPTGPQGLQGDPGNDGADGADGPGVDPGYAIDVTGVDPRVVDFDPTEITGFAAGSFQIFAHDTTAGETTNPDDPPWKSVAQYDTTKKQLWWHQSGAFNFETTTDYGGAADTPQFLVNWGAGNGGDWQWKSAGSYDSAKIQTLDHNTGTWVWNTSFRVSATENDSTPSVLHDAINDAATYSATNDGLVKTDTVGAGGTDQKERLFLDSSVITGWDDAKNQVLAHKLGVLQWIDLGTCS